jgi:hypothetical protein
MNIAHRFPSKSFFDSIGAKLPRRLRSETSAAGGSADDLPVLRLGIPASPDIEKWGKVIRAAHIKLD